MLDIFLFYLILFLYIFLYIFNMILLIISLFVIIIGIVIAGFKLSSKIKDIEIQLFFWVLYGVTILSLFLLSVCIYIFITYRKKTGPFGPRGFQGYPGSIGDPGSCDQNLCRPRTLAILMEKIIEEFNQKPVDENIRKKLCGFVTYDKDKNHPDILKKWNLMDIKIFRDIFKQKVTMTEEILVTNIDDILKQTIIKFNNKIDGTKKLEVIDIFTNC
jgi:hypothetical protein